MKKYTISFLFIVLVCMADCYAQPLIQWQKSLGGTLSDQPYSIQQTSEGGYIIAGSSVSSDGDVSLNHGGSCVPGCEDYFIVKTNHKGNIQWTKSLGGAGLDEAKSVQQTSDGGYIVAGNSFANDGDVTGHHGTTYYSDIWVVKLNHSGEIEWRKSYGGSDGDYASRIIQTNDGGFIISGYALSTNYDLTTNNGSFDYWILKISAFGTIEWQKSYGGTQSDQAHSIQQTADGGYVIAGISKSNDGDVTGHHGGSFDYDSDYWVVKLNSIGNLQWQKSLGGTDVDAAYSIQQTGDGGFIVAGTSLSNDGDVTGNHGSSSGLGDFWVVKLNNIGTIEWQKCLGGLSGDAAKSIQQTTDGGYIVGGATYSNEGDVTGYHGGIDYWIVKLDYTGTIQWQKTLGGTGADWTATSIQQTIDEGYVVAGYSASNDGDVTNNNGEDDFWIVKLSPAYNIISGSVFIDNNSDCLLDNGENSLKNRIVQALPGPYYSTTDSEGNYLIWVDTLSYAVSLVPRLYWTQDCPVGNNSHTVTFNEVDTIATDIDFSSYISSFCPDVRIGIGSAFQRKCFSNNRYVINVCNEGTAFANDATISLQFPPQIVPLSSTVSWAIGTNDEYIFNVGNLLPDECTQFIITDSVSCNSTMGEIVCVSASVVLVPQAADCNFSDNATSECNAIIFSHDPNDKQVASQQFEQNGYLNEVDFLLGDTLRYIIRFQNTGNDTAFTVVVTDTLSQWLDPTTVVTDVASHYFDFRISGHGVLEWTFNNILLPDSNVNEAASHGFIKYRIMPRDTMPIGGEIHNEANIYFDFNEPVITNQTISTLSIITSIIENNTTHASWIYPNPATTEITVNGYSPAYLKLYNTLGQTVAEATKTNKLWVGNLPQGLYLLQLYDENGNLVKTERVVKE